MKTDFEHAAGAGWQPPTRPTWVSTLNAIGTNLAGDSVVDLREDSLLDAARTLTGLDDFGDDAWRVPFRLILADLAAGDFNLTGRLLARIDILKSLAVRLQMAETEKRYPEIREQPITEPIFITGLGRTGTSILVELIGQDVSLRPALGWEYRYPSPPPVAGHHDELRIRRSFADIKLWEEVIPELPAIHETAITEPDEDSMGQMHEFVSPIWSGLHRLPSFEKWALTDGSATALRFQRRILQHLQWKKPGRFILKNPSLLSVLPSLFSEFADARVVVTHRDPLKVMASSVDMLATLRWQRSDHVDHAEIVQRVAMGYPFLLDMLTKQRSEGIVPEDRFVDLRFADLMSDHIGAIRSVYEQLGLSLSEEAASRMRAYLVAKPKDRHGPRSYRFEDLGLDRAETRRNFERYMKHFDIPEEN